jgi:hypothetical protein
MRSHADDIVGDYFDGEDWGTLDDVVDDEPELELPPLPPPAAPS